MEYLPHILVGAVVLAIYLGYEWEASRPGYFLRLILRKGQPSCNGRTFEDCLKDLKFIERFNLEVAGEGRFKPTEKYTRAAEAMRKMGAEALPPLVAIIRANQPGLVLKSERKWREAKFDLELHESNEAAIEAFKALGDAAAPAIPELEQLLHKRESAEKAAEVLAAIGAMARPALLKGLAHPLAFVRVAVAREYLSFQEDAAPLLRTCLKDPDPTVRFGAALALAGWDENPESTLPVLIDGIRANEERVMIVMAAIQLGAMGEKARPAFPALLEAHARSGEGEALARPVVKQALFQIDPVVAREAGLVEG